jgi:hypothetical protein
MEFENTDLVSILYYFFQKKHYLNQKLKIWKVTV